MPPGLESVFTFLFNYPPAVFEQGKVVLSGIVAAPVVATAVALLAVGVIFSYSRVRGTARPRQRAALAVLRVAILTLICFSLAGPYVELLSAVPQRNFIGVLLDDSRSMRIADENGRPRHDAMRSLFGRDSALARRLSGRFQLRYFRFSGTAERASGPDSLAFAGRRTRLGPALQRVREELAQVPLAGIVVVSDGADNALDSLEMGPGAVPLYTVGLGAERFAKDIEISEVHGPASTLEGSTVAVDLVLSQSGYSGRTVQLRAEEGGRILGTRDVELAGDGTAVPVRMLVPAPEPGTRTMQFSIIPEPGELVAENNRREVDIEVRRGPEKILYYEGEPRFELKFLRRAVADDRNLRLVTLERTAEKKYLRLGVEDSLELVGGFPTTREELFAYRGIVLGSVEASAFTVDQLRMLADFVIVRGGGLLVLGGRRALAEGGYAGTPLAEALPVLLGAADTGFFSELRVRPSSVGAAHPAMQLAGDEKASSARWRTLPPLTTVNRIAGTRPGATVLLSGSGDKVQQPVLAFQRYGRGKAIAFAVQDSWLWQMHADIPVEDRTHETLWRQLLRWLVNDVPDRVAIAAGTERAMPGEPVALTADVRDERYDAVNDAPVVARVTAPSGTVTEVPMSWGAGRDGEFRASWVPAEEGRHEVAVAVPPRPGRKAGAAASSFVVGTSDDELVGATMRAPLLRRLAERSGGRFYTSANASSLPDDIAIGGAGVTVREQRELWNMPVIFLALIALLGAEWTLRRRLGLA
jgi:uncharacterized membrane protein